MSTKKWRISSLQFGEGSLDKTYDCKSALSCKVVGQLDHNDMYSFQKTKTD